MCSYRVIIVICLSNRSYLLRGLVKMRSLCNSELHKEEFQCLKSYSFKGRAGRYQ